MGSPVLPHATRCPEGGRATNKREHWRKESEVGILLKRGVGAEMGWGSGSLSQWGHISTPRGQPPSPGQQHWLAVAFAQPSSDMRQVLGRAGGLSLFALPSSQLGFPSYKAGTSPIPYLPGGTLSRSEIMSALAQPSTEGGSF